MTQDSWTNGKHTDADAALMSALDAHDEEIARRKHFSAHRRQAVSGCWWCEEAGSTSWRD